MVGDDRWRDWAPRYHRERMSRFDPALRMMRTRNQPFTWSQARARYASPQAEYVMEVTDKTKADIKTGFRGRAIVEGGAGTAARTVGLLGGIFSFAVSEGIVAANPVRGVRRPADNRRDIRLTGPTPPTREGSVAT